MPEALKPAQEADMVRPRSFDRLNHARREPLLRESSRRHSEFETGYQANTDGKAPADNPHPEGTTQRDAWGRGWDAAQTVREEWESYLREENENENG